MVGGGGDGGEGVGEEEGAEVGGLEDWRRDVF